MTASSAACAPSRRQVGLAYSDQHVHHSVPVLTPPRSAADRTQHPRSRWAVLLQFGREVVLGPSDALRAAPGSAALRYARSSTFRENILDEHEHRRRPADVAATYSEPNEQTLDAWRGETNQWEAIDTDRGATE